ncbi:MAG TPA: carotenoid oxygenase family protein [Polyangiaceae bacterium]|nr:carotenoid oxygenase family protein [Polyangiaceae bacterium]
MVQRFSRRDVFRLSGLGALSLFHAPLVGGCSSGSSKAKAGLGAGDGGLLGDSGVPAWNYDPNVSWWMQFNYGPVAEERTETTLEVVGTIPPELDGLYLRNGSNPKHGDPGHWFIGNGMVHGVRLKGGKALWYRNRYVQTPLLDPAPKPDAGASIVGPPGPTETDSNVSVIAHAGKLLALGEVGLPFELSAEDLSTVGPYDYAGKLTTWMTAHPKIDPVSGEMLFFGYGALPPYLTYHRVDAQGVLTRSEVIDLPSGVMMHDFQVTATKVVFMDLPIVFDLAMAAAGAKFPFRWDPTHQARIGIMPRDGGNADVKWVNIDTCYVFHTMNAYDDADGNVVLECCRYPELWKNGPDGFDAFPRLHRFVIDGAAGTATLTQLDERLVEFPQIDRRKMGREHRYSYGLWLDDPNGQDHPNGVGGIVKWDRTADTSSVHLIEPALQPDEAFFVPASSGAAEDEGYLLSYVYDRRTDRSELQIFDASNMNAGLVASVKLPFRVPFGFHGVWVPA